MASAPITFILPCAGKGTRLGLPYPKEIHRIKPDVSLVDFSLGHIKAGVALTEKAVVVVAPGKEIVANYVEDRLDGDCHVERVYFNEKYTEWPGSIRSAETHFGVNNIALLPDSVLTPKGQDVLAQKFSAEFARGADLVFAYLPETDRTRLTSLGALNVEDGNVSEFCDKPETDNEKQFNAFWTAFGFRGEVGVSVLEFMSRSVARERVDVSALGLKIRAFPVADYIDLGTWPAIATYLSAAALR